MPLQDFLANLFGFGQHPYQDELDFIRAQIEGDEYVGKQYVPPPSAARPGDIEALRRQVEGPAYGAQAPFTSASPELEERMRQYYETGGPIIPMPEAKLTPFAEGLTSGPSLEEETKKSFEQNKPIEVPKGVAKERVEAHHADKVAKEQAAQAAEAEQKAADKAMKESLDPLSWVGGGAPGSGKQFPIDKLMRIREQAKAKGRAGSLRGPGITGSEDYLKPSIAGTGGFVSAENTPEVQRRFADMERWVADQPMREQEFMASEAQARRNPALAQEAAKRLTEMKAARVKEQEAQFVNSLVQNLGQGGVIPFAQGMQLRAAGAPIPISAIDDDPRDTEAFFNNAMQKSGEFLLTRDPMGIVDETTARRIKFERSAHQLAELWLDRAKTGQVSQRDAKLRFMEAVTQIIMELGLQNVASAQEQGAQYFGSE